MASLIGLRQTAAFEGQVAMMLEFALADGPEGDAYPFRFDAGVLDWQPLIEEVLHDLAAGLGPASASRTVFTTR